MNHIKPPFSHGFSYGFSIHHLDHVTYPGRLQGLLAEVVAQGVDLGTGNDYIAIGKTMGKWWFNDG